MEPPSPSSAVPHLENAEPGRARTMFERRVRDPLVLQLTQGITPEKIALTLAFGFSLGMFPVFGFTTLFCFCAAYVLKLNQPMIQLLNQALWPVHLPVFFACWKIGETMFHVAPDERIKLSPRVIYNAFRSDLMQAFHDYGEGLFHTIIVWAILVPPTIVVVYYVSLPIIRSVTRIKTEVAAKKAADGPPTVP